MSIAEILCYVIITILFVVAGLGAWRQWPSRYTLEALMVILARGHIVRQEHLDQSRPMISYRSGKRTICMICRDPQGQIIWDIFPWKVTWVFHEGKLLICERDGKKYDAHATPELIKELLSAYAEPALQPATVAIT